MTLTPPGEAAQALGVSEAMLRQLAGDHYYGRWIQAESPGQGGRRGRMYTERDMLLLRYVVRTERSGTPHKKIKQNIEDFGLEAVLRAAVAAEEAVPVLEETVDRLHLDVAKAMEERDGLLRDKQRLEAAIEQQRQQMEAQLAEAYAQAEQARALHSQVRAGALVISRQVEVWMERVRLNLGSLSAAREKLHHERSKITETLTSANSRLGSLSGWLLQRSSLRAELREAEVRLERIEEAERDITAVEDSMMQVMMDLMGKLTGFKETALLPGHDASLDETGTGG